MVKKLIHSSFSGKDVTFLAAAILCASLFSACRETTTSPLGSSTFAGRIALFDSAGHATNDFSGVTVQIDNTNFQTTTNTDGSWEIDNVPAGQYDISATKAGFGTFYWFEQTATGGRYDLETAALAEMPNIVPSPIPPVIGEGVLEFGGPISDTDHIGLCSMLIRIPQRSPPLLIWRWMPIQKLNISPSMTYEPQERKRVKSCM